MAQDTWVHYNELLLDSDVDRIRKLAVRADLFRMALDVPGDIVECGVFKGAGLMYWLKLLAIYLPATRKKVIGFDTFGGFPDTLLDYEESTADRYIAEATLQGVDAKAIQERIDATGLADRAELVPGAVEDTLPSYAKENTGFRISLLNLDLDTYSGTMAALESLYPAVSKGGVIVLDEYADRGWGESDAVDEFFKGVDVEIKSVPHSDKPTAYIIKP